MYGEMVLIIASFSRKGFRKIILYFRKPKVPISTECNFYPNKSLTASLSLTKLISGYSNFFPGKIIKINSVNDFPMCPVRTYRKREQNSFRRIIRSVR